MGGEGVVAPGEGLWSLETFFLETSGRKVLEKVCLELVSQMVGESPAAVDSERDWKWFSQRGHEILPLILWNITLLLIVGCEVLVVSVFSPVSTSIPIGILAAVSLLTPSLLHCNNSV